MSFRLYVWHEAAPISADEAGAKVRRWLDDDLAPPTHPAVRRLRDELVRMFPPGDSPEIWTVPPGPSDALVVLACDWSRAGEFGAAVRRLAARHGLVCYEPQSHLLDPNAPAQRAGSGLP